MKVAIISQHSGKSQRGAENWAYEVSNRLGDEVQVISGNYFFKIKNILTADTLVPVNGRIQVVFIKLISLIFRKKLIIFGHSGPGADDKWNLLMKPDVFVTFSSHQKKWANKFNYFMSEVIVIPHAIDINKFTPKKENKKTNTVLCVAANTKDKRADLVKKAVDKLDGVNLTLVGSGQEREVNYKDMPKVYQKADVFCFVPQPWEAFGLVYLEALASNLPIVTINDPTRREIVDKAGILVKNPENSLQLAKAIKIALNKNWSDIPRKQSEKYAWENVILEYKQLFRL